MTTLPSPVSRRTFLPALEFVAAWNSSDSVAEFCGLFGIRTKTAYARACTLRTQGFDIKSYAVEKLVRTCEHCGQEFRVSPSKVKEGNGRFCSRKCGGHSSRNQTHGECYTRLYSIWHGIEQRCNNKNKREYEFYGARGITMCHEWASRYEAFRDWANANGYSDELEIDRRDTLGNYEPGNCRWVTRRQQVQNTRKRSDAKTSIYKGVYQNKHASWVVQVHTPGRPIYRGSFATELEAAKEYDRIVRIEFGEHAHLNFPQPQDAQSADGELHAEVAS